ncbi:Oidioi.mRNA.OKI2018_I69.chr2.g5448.t1.cds [Oikopleura dioica]|uniref:Oidioi.mRNA.OKI2018_I69.chr2.g5448.t1.cds n=1 Tax=Oikopleura dioica TaxID=34765 RepID=A0ABN7T224_OIKDI|nr:Oidioi.mRNA.OKI2018_I69.chr2.g5448.t1.cds [Oikopleura dioica]
MKLLNSCMLAAALAGRTPNPTKRLNKIKGHTATLIDLMDNNTTASDKNVGRVQAWTDKLFGQLEALDLTPCAADEVDEGDDNLVFDQENYCKLAGQVQTALRSYLRTFVCVDSYPKKNFERAFSKRTNRVRNIASRAGDC